MMLNTSLKAMLAALMLLAIPSVQGPTLAGEQPNVLVMGEDDDPDTVPRNHRVFNRVIEALNTEMAQMGFRVYDETSVSLDIQRQGRIRRNDAELITVAKRIQQPPIDVIAVFSIYVNVQQNINADVWDMGIRVPGRLLHVQTGRALDAFEVDYPTGSLPPVPPNCLSAGRRDNDCLFEFVGGQAGRIAQDLGSVLAQKLDYLSPARNNTTPGISTAPAVQTSPGVTSGRNCTGMTTAYVISIRNFDPADVSAIEEYLVAFSGYDHHRPMRSTARQSEYWYETCSDVARLNRNLRMMLEQMGLEGRIAMTGNRFEVERIGPQRSR